MINFLTSLFRKPGSFRIVPPMRTGMDLQDWQKDKRLCAVTANLLREGHVQLMMAVLKNHHPGSMVIDPETNPNARVVLQARAEGYTMAIANLEAMAKYKNAEPFREPDFGAEEPMEIKPE